MTSDQLASYTRADIEAGKAKRKRLHSLPGYKPPEPMLVEKPNPEPNLGEIEPSNVVQLPKPPEQRKRLTFLPPDDDGKVDRFPICIPDIQREVCWAHGITRQELISDRRTAKVVRPRQIAMYLCKRLTTRSYPYIGGRFGGRDHTTVVYAVRRVTELIETDADFKSAIESMEERIRNG